VASRAAFAEPRTIPAAAPKPAPEVVATACPCARGAGCADPSGSADARDNLQRISGIDAQTEQRLAAQAVTRYSQIAHWSPSDVERFERLLGTSRRIARENWIEQAQILSRDGDTAFSREFDRREAEAAAQLRPAKLSDAIREHSAAKSSETKSTEPVEPKSSEEVRSSPRPDLGSLRSVRSELIRPPSPAPRPRAASPASPRWFAPPISKT
jgi:predicted flap endonuclease-1-like 5' DNA nuclease